MLCKQTKGGNPISLYGFPNIITATIFLLNAKHEKTLKIELTITAFPCSLLVYLPRWFDQQETAKGPFWPSSHYYQFNRSEVEAIPLSAFPKNTTSELARLYLHTILF